MNIYKHLHYLLSAAIHDMCNYNVSITGIDTALEGIWDRGIFHVRIDTPKGCYTDVQNWSYTVGKDKQAIEYLPQILLQDEGNAGSDFPHLPNPTLERFYTELMRKFTIKLIRCNGSNDKPTVGLLFYDPQIMGDGLMVRYCSRNNIGIQE